MPFYVLRSKKTLAKTPYFANIESIRNTLDIREQILYNRNRNRIGGKDHARIDDH